MSKNCDAITHQCLAPSCTDGIKNGNETDFDCGGGTCPACATGNKCLVNTDCASNACDALSQTCVASQCIDHQTDGSETDVDCGGGTCPKCAVNKLCTINGDCASTACDFITGRCVTSQCVDQHKDGSETDVDCGGGSCPACVTGLKCSADTDCASNACDALSLTCVANQCADHQKDGVETDVDCGGGSCPKCALANKCSADADCASNACDAISLTCVSNQCIDHRQDGLETDVDCGGGTCSACAVGQKCNNNFDCQPGHFCNGSKVCQ